MLQKKEGLQLLAERVSDNRAAAQGVKRGAQRKNIWVISPTCFWGVISSLIGCPETLPTRVPLLLSATYSPARGGSGGQVVTTTTTQIFRLHENNTCCYRRGCGGGMEGVKEQKAGWEEPSLFISLWCEIMWSHHTRTATWYCKGDVCQQQQHPEVGEDGAVRWASVTLLLQAETQLALYVGLYI